ncbi:TPA: hypothetical protein ACPI87_000787 [Haemophilus influenzae]|uniref:hypothetical protein n=1 Tax=Haemophilus influenzae TaxID=727 RepID=UPI000D4816F8|nr:hypothetical protein [Haemophilus influenzae]PRM18344.1 hypothetical protein BV011_00488 [Haemophilus influenzae]
MVALANVPLKPNTPTPGFFSTGLARKTKYSYIHINVKQMGIEPLLRQHLQEQYSAGSLTDLSDDQLTKVYQFIAGKKRTLFK